MLAYESYYLGENGVGQHLFGNGSKIATEVFNSLPEAVKALGSRIVIDEASLKYSVFYNAGLKHALSGAAYAAPTAPAARLEYGFGYIKGLLTRRVPRPAPAKLTPPVAVPAEAPVVAPKKRGRRKGGK